MIKANDGKVTLKGHPVDVVTDLASITRGIMKALDEFGMPREDAEKFVRHSFELALKSEEELRAEAQQKLGNLLVHLGEMMVDDKEEEGEQTNE